MLESKQNENMVLETTTKKEVDGLCFKIITAAIEVHRELGSTQLPSLYHCCFKHELKLRGIKFESEFFVPVRYKGGILEADLRIDFVIEGKVLIIIKSDLLIPDHTTQILAYMKLLRAPKGLLLNFACKNLFHEGQRTVANGLYQNLL
jgi:GxxExxY protein